MSLAEQTVWECNDLRLYILAFVIKHPDEIQPVACREMIRNNIDSCLLECWLNRRDECFCNCVMCCCCFILSFGALRDCCV